MNIMKKLIELLRNMFKKKNNIKMIDSPKLERKVENVIENRKEKFRKSLLISGINRKIKIRTLICEGDGLGIQNSIKY